MKKNMVVDERELMEMYKEYNSDLGEKVPELYILSMGFEENKKALEISENLRMAGVTVEKDILERSFKSQMKYADRIKAKKLLVIGENELAEGKAKIKNMVTGEEKEVSLTSDAILEILK